MNGRKLAAIGIPQDCIKKAVAAAVSAAKYNRTVEKSLRLDIKNKIQQVSASPDSMVDDTYFGDLARSIIENNKFIRPEAITYKTWGDDGIDPGSHDQMKIACSLPNAAGAALMPDAHIGYGLPIGGVLALDNAVCPYAVGVDIGCRLKLTVYGITAKEMSKKSSLFESSLERGTVFGVGGKQRRRANHPVMDQDWDITPITRRRKDVAHDQLGTSGSGNHFAEWGILFLDHDNDALGLKAGEYAALLSHSGSRGAGAAICEFYSNIARHLLPAKYDYLNQLAWLDMDKHEGQEYWAAMNLMGDYASANHDIIHQNVAAIIGEKPLTAVENHHNFAWIEEHGGKKLYVHRKGATPAGVGMLGVIPGSMGDPAYVVMGKGNAESLCSASHGAGRRMSRKKAKETYNFKVVREDLARKGIKILSAGADEVPGVYKSINEVMARQTDLVESLARFEPRIVKMCGDGSKPED